MKKMLVATLSGMAAMATLALLSTPAEAVETRSRIPFSFEVRGETFPPGEYTFAPGTPGPENLWVRGHGRGAVAMTLGLQSATNNGARVVFERQGDTYLLREVWSGTFGHELVRSRRRGERRPTAKEGAAVEKVAIPGF